MITRKQFHTEVDKIQKPEDVEYILNQHAKQRRTTIIFLSVSIVIALISIIYLVDYMPSESTTILSLCIVVPILLLIILIGLAIISSTYQTKMAEELKIKYTPQVIDILLKDYNHTFSGEKYIPESIFKSSPFYSSYDSFKGEDLLKINIPNDDGTPSKVVLNVCDILATETETYEDSDGDTHTRTVTKYNGVFGHIKFPFKFKCSLGLNCYKGNLKRIELEDINFNKEFRTYTDDQLEALIILTPTLMVKLLEFNNRNYDFKCFLNKNGEFYFGVGYRLFETHYPKINEPFHLIFDKFYNDIENILSIVEEIKNNNKTFKM